MTRIDALKRVSASLSIPDYTWLDKLISFESLWNPKAKNVISGARGLIQFTNTTSKKLGFKSADDLVNKYPDSVDQLLGPVYNYLRAYAPFPTRQSLYMSVFYPSARNWNLTVQFPKWVTDLNPGIDTVASYVRKVDRRRASPVVVTVMVVAVVVAAAILYNNTKTKGGCVWEEKETMLIG
jgi:flagellin-like protein